MTGAGESERRRPSKGQLKRRTAFANFLTAVLTVVTAALTLLSVWLGIQNEQLASAKADAVSKASAQATVIVKLQETTENLKSQIAAAPGDTTAPVGTELPADVSLRHEDSALTIQSNNSVDLDALPSDPQWKSGDGSGDLYFLRGELDPSGDAQMLVLGSKPATYAACDTTGYGSAGLSLDNSAQPGEYFCIETSGGRLAAAVLSAITSDSVTFAVKVYDPPIKS